jgi:hypothetical protein
MIAAANPASIEFWFHFPPFPLAFNPPTINT